MRLQGFSIPEAVGQIGGGWAGLRPARRLCCCAAAWRGGTEASGGVYVASDSAPTRGKELPGPVCLTDLLTEERKRAIIGCSY